MSLKLQEMLGVLFAGLGVVLAIPAWAWKSHPDLHALPSDLAVAATTWTSVILIIGGVVFSVLARLRRR